MIAGGTAEHHQVEQRVGAQTVGAVHGHAGAFADGVQAADHVGRVVALGNHHLTMIVGGDATHLIVDGGHDRDGFLDGIDVGELERDLADGRQTLEDLLGAQVIELEQHVIAVRAAAAPFLDLLVHRARHEVTRCQVLQRGAHSAP